MTYVFKELCGGMPAKWRVIRDGFVRRSQAEAFAVDWFIEHGHTVIDRENDAEHNAIDYMTTRNGYMYQYAVEPCKA